MSHPIAYMGVGSPAAQSGAAITPPLPNMSIVEYDLAIIFSETANQTISYSGWTQVPDSPQGTGTAGGTAASRLTAYYKVAVAGGTIATQVSNDSGDHNIGSMLVIRGADRTNPFNATAGAVRSSAGTTATIPGDTTTVDGCLVIAASTRENDSSAAAFSAWANSDLASITERVDTGSTAGNGGGYGIATGIKTTAGAYGNTTATVTSSLGGMMSIAIAPQSDLNNTTVTALTQDTGWFIGSQDWSRNGHMGRVDPYGAAHNLVALCWNGSAWRFKVSTDNGATWTAITPTGISGLASNRLCSVAFSSDGILHAAFSDPNAAYASFTLTRDGSGNVTAAAQRSVCAAPSLAADNNWNYFPWLEIVTDGVAMERVALISLVSANYDADSNNRIGHLEFTCSVDTDPSDLSSWKNAAGSTSSYDTLYTGTSRADLDSHIACAGFKQNPSTGALLWIVGLNSNETVNTQGAGNGNMRRGIISQNSGNWTIGATSLIEAATASRGPEFGGFCRSDTEVFFVARYVDDKLWLSKWASDNTFTQKSLECPVQQQASLSSPWIDSQISCNAAGTQFWVTAIASDNSLDATNTAKAIVCFAHYNGTSWDKVYDTSNYVSTAVTATYLLPGMSQIADTRNGMVVLANNQWGNQGSWSAMQHTTEAATGVSGSGDIVVSALAPSVSGSVAITSTGSVTALPLASSASGLVSHTSSGSNAFSSLTASASGLSSHASTGSAALSPLAELGSALATNTGTGSAATSSLACSGSGLEMLTSSGDISPSSIGAIGNGLLSYTSSGSSVVAGLTASAAGEVGDVIMSSGSIALAQLALASTGALSLTSSGAIATNSFALSGSGLDSLMSSGSAAISSFAIEGSGAQAAGNVGSGSIGLQSLTASGSGALALTGSGNIAASPFAQSGTSAVSLTSSGSSSLQSLAFSTSGLQGYIATGSIALASPVHESNGAIAINSSGSATVRIALDGTGIVLQLAIESSGAFTLSSLSYRGTAYLGALTAGTITFASTPYGYVAVTAAPIGSITVTTRRS